ncbi:MAG: winged helix-turn-helix domain-containing protein [Promethearchaeota archaeon]
MPTKIGSEKKKPKSYKKILEALKNAPIYEGFTVKELSREIKMPEPTARWHLEILEASGEIQSTYIGKTRLFKRTKGE